MTTKPAAHSPKPVIIERVIETPVKRKDGRLRLILEVHPDDLVKIIRQLQEKPPPADIPF